MPRALAFSLRKVPPTGRRLTMPRALAFSLRKVPPTGRGAAELSWREQHASLTAEGCHHWVFQSESDETSFLEFTEARDAATLSGARERAGLPPAPIFMELELS